MTDEFEHPADQTCAVCGYGFETEEEAAACEDGHLIAEEEMGVFDA